MRYTSCTVKLTQLRFLGYVLQLFSWIILLFQQSFSLLLVGHWKGNVLFNNSFFAVNMDKLDFFLKYSKTAHSYPCLKYCLCLKKQLSSGFSLLKPHLLKESTSLICLAFLSCWVNTFFTVVQYSCRTTCLCRLSSLPSGEIEYVFAILLGF